jgi:hypothetical protein
MHNYYKCYTSARKTLQRQHLLFHFPRLLLSCDGRCLLLSLLCQSRYLVQQRITLRLKVRE